MYRKVGVTSRLLAKTGSSGIDSSKQWRRLRPGDYREIAVNLKEKVNISYLFLS